MKAETGLQERVKASEDPVDEFVQIDLRSAVQVYNLCSVWYWRSECDFTLFQ